MNLEPVWWRDGIIYQIYPRSFADSNGDGIGDLNGILSRLDYLAWLGVDAIWLSPIYPSPDVDFGYDVADYVDIDPKFGTLADFDRLVAEAHARGIRVVLDLVLNHTSDQHRWFQESRASLDNPYRNYYFWREPKPGGKPPNNWLSIFGGEGWTPDPATGQMYFHTFYREQPDVNWRNPAVRAEMLNVFRFWLERGVDGFRLDVFNGYFKQADLRDNPVRFFGLRPYDRQDHIHDCDQPEMFPLLREIRALLDEQPGRYAVGETFLGGAQRAARYCGEDLLNATFNFNILGCGWNPAAYLRVIQEWERLLDGRAWPTYVLNNHDIRRSASRFGRGQSDERLKAAAAMLLTLRGTPFLYYGEEIGQRELRVPHSEIQDPIGRRYWPIYVGRDGCRAPMQWDSSETGGFSPPGSRPPWLPLHPEWRSRNVASQQADPASLLNTYRRLIALRRAHPALQRGMFLPLTPEPRALLAYLRQTKDETLLVVINFSRRRQRYVLGRTLNHSTLELLFSSRRDALPPRKGDLLVLEPEEALIFCVA